LAHSAHQYTMDNDKWKRAKSDIKRLALSDTKLRSINNTRDMQISGKWQVQTFKL